MGFWRPSRRRLATGLAAALTLLGSAAVAAPHHRPASLRPPAPTFASYPIPDSLGSANNSGEPSVGVDWRSGAVLYQAGFATYRLKLTDGTWTDVSSPYTGFNIDPILVTDPWSGVTLAGGDDGSCSILAVTTDDGDNWQPSLPCSFTPDHPTVGIGPAVGTSRQANKRVVYFCQQYPWVNECAASTDDGTTWLPAVPVQGGCIGPSGHVKVSADGTAYLPIRACNDDGSEASLTSGAHVGGAVSLDNGRTWNSYRIPGAVWPTHGFDPSVATTPDNTVYESWPRYGDYLPMVASSKDHTKTWSRPVDISHGSGFPIYASTFETVVAGDDGRVAVAYLGADRPPEPGTTVFDPGYVGAWYLYASYTYDAGAHWVTTRIQQAPVQLGPICDVGTRCLSGRNLLDFMDASFTSDGRLVVGYANGCAGGCPADPAAVAQSVNAWGVVAVQKSGMSLFGRFGSF